VNSHTLISLYQHSLGFLESIITVYTDSDMSKGAADWRMIYWCLTGQGRLKKYKQICERKQTDEYSVNKGPHRHDLIPESCVNKEVVKFNRQMEKIVQLHPNVHLLEANLDRNYFTKHGTHLNYNGKEIYAQQLATIVEKVCSKEQTVPIYNPRKVPSPAPNDKETQDLNTDDIISESAESSRHGRNCPARRDPDFYGHKSPIYSGHTSSNVEQRQP